MNEDENSMIQKNFKTQLKTRRPKDWISSILKDLEDMKMELTIDEIKDLKIATLKRLITKEIAKMAFQRLISIKETHSKARNLKYCNLKMQNYLKPSRVKLTEEEIQTIFKIRSRVTDVKLNYRGKYENLECRVCKKEEESQKHLYECDDISKSIADNRKKVEFEKIFGENLRNQVEIAKEFIKRMKIKS